MWVCNEIVKCDRPTNIRYFVHCFPLADSHFWIGIALISYCDARYCWKSNLLSFHWNCSHKTSIIQIYAEIKCIRRRLCRMHTHKHTNNSIQPKTEFSKSNYSTKMSAKRWICCCCRYGSTQHRVCSCSFCWMLFMQSPNVHRDSLICENRTNIRRGYILIRIELMAIADKFRELQNYDVHII